MIKPSAPRLAIVLIVLSMSFCADEASGLIIGIDASRNDVTRSEGTYLGQEFISAILVLEPAIRQGLLFARVLCRQPQRLWHSAFHEARPIVLLNPQSQVHGRRMYVLEREQPRHSTAIITCDYPQGVFLFFVDAALSFLSRRSRLDNARNRRSHALRFSRTSLGDDSRHWPISAWFLAL